MIVRQNSSIDLFAGDAGDIALNLGESEAVCEEFIADFLARPLARSGHFSSLDAIAQLTGDTLVRRAVPGPLHLRLVPNSLEVVFPGGVCAHSRATLEAMTYIVAQTHAFRIRDVGGLSSDEERVALVASLIRDGVLAA